MAGRRETLSRLGTCREAPSPLSLSPHRDSRALPLRVWRGDTSFGHPHGGAMHFGFGDLIAHAATTRDPYPGTVIGSGTVSNRNAEEVGSSCIAERRALDALAGRSAAAYLRDGERVRLALRKEGESLLVGLDQIMHIRNID